MKKRMTGWIVGGLIAVSALGLTISTSIGSAAEKNAAQPPAMQGMMQNGQMGTMDMNSPEMQKQCLDMMKNADMQQAMKSMMRTPEMQAMMKQMLASDPELRQMMSDLVNSIEPNDQNNSPVPSSSVPAPMPEGMDHSTHHSM